MLPYYFFHSPRTADRPWRPKVEELAPNCPRCDSSNTKFCYYNNYCLSQPRYLCKGCRRYWTKGGSLRNVPVGGGRQKSRRGKSLKHNSIVSSSLSSPPNSFRPDHALETMSGGKGESFLWMDQSIDHVQLYAKFLNQCPELEQQEEAVPMPMMTPFDQKSFENQSSAEIGAEAALSNIYVEKGLIGEKHELLHDDQFMEVERRELMGGLIMDSNVNYCALETDQMWESSRFQEIGMSEMAQQNAVGLTSLEAFL